jgi:hypothetical protein
MLKKASRTSLSAAKNAEQLERTLPRLTENTSQLLALTAAAKLRFPSSPEKTDLYIAAIALQSRRKTNLII